MADDPVDPFDLRIWPHPPPKPTPKIEHLWTLTKADQRVDCELSYRGEWGVVAQFYRDGALFCGWRFNTRTLAVEWAESERAEWQAEGFS